MWAAFDSALCSCPAFEKEPSSLQCYFEQNKINLWSLFNNQPHEAQTNHDEKRSLGVVGSQCDTGKLQREKRE